MAPSLWQPATKDSSRQRLSQYFWRWVRGLESRAMPNCVYLRSAASSHPQVLNKRCVPTLSPLTGMRLWIQAVSFLGCWFLVWPFTTVLAQSPTPTNQPSPSPTPFNLTDLIPTEIMSCPASGQPEWLELYNQGSTTATLTNWQIEDAAGTTKPVNLSLAPHSYGLVEWSGSLLNNSGDTLALWTNSDQLLLVAELGSCTAGQSFVLVANQWQLSTTPTPGTANPQPSPTPPPTPGPTTTPSPTPNSSPWFINTTTNPTQTGPTPTPAVSPAANPDPNAIQAPTKNLLSETAASNYLHRLQQSLLSFSKPKLNVATTSTASASQHISASPEPTAAQQVLPPDEPLYPELQAAIGSAILGGSAVAGLGMYLLYAEINRLRQAAPPPLELPPDSVLVDLN